jgi:hypothetical protein
VVDHDDTRLVVVVPMLKPMKVDCGVHDCKNDD